MLAHRPVAFFERAPEYRFGFQQFAAHAVPLRTLTGEHECDFPGFGDFFRRRRQCFFELLDQFRTTARDECRPVATAPGRLADGQVSGGVCPQESQSGAEQLVQPGRCRRGQRDKVSGGIHGIDDTREMADLVWVNGAG
ncbi:hypothetical protein [Amycolatopsis magusensis]|uniref:hypothetical protein n=1 Tax=Amycolatopsis magusensis TaxID=882444 RepID=UPI003C30AD81